MTLMIMIKEKRTKKGVRDWERDRKREREGEREGEIELRQGKVRKINVGRRKEGGEEGEREASRS
jgi:hypothetical protein